MYRNGYDGRAGLLVGLFTGTSSSEQDFEAQFEALRRLDADGHDRSDALAYVLEIEHRHASPDARMRKQIVEVWASLRAPRIAMAVVTTSMLHRGPRIPRVRRRRACAKGFDFLKSRGSNPGIEDKHGKSAADYLRDFPKDGVPLGVCGPK